jgi:ribonuclease Z
MSIEYQVLGKPGKDNALFVRLNSGTKMYRILFDCGEKTLEELKQSDVRNIDYIFFSHLHIDHVAGFDYFFRRNYDRIKPIFIWGPEETAEIIHNRLLGYKWNLIGDSGGNWFISDISENAYKQFYIKFPDGFRDIKLVGKKEFKDDIFETNDFVIRKIKLNHIIPSIGYYMFEKPLYNIDKSELEKSKLPPGKWLEKLKDLSLEDSQKIEIEGKRFQLGELRKNMMKTSKGMNIAYLTDFVWENNSKEKLINFLNDCEVLICESQYSKEDSELAKTNYHLTTLQAAALAKEAGVKRLILFHLSERYQTDFKKLLDEAREIFPDTFFPEEWEDY